MELNCCGLTVNYTVGKTHSVITRQSDEIDKRFNGHHLGGGKNAEKSETTVTV